MLRALFTAAYWANTRTMAACAQWADQVADPVGRPWAIRWLEHHLTERPPNPETGDPGSSPEEIDQWSSAKAKLATLFQADAGGQSAGAMSTLAQILDTWRDPMVTEIAAMRDETGELIARRLDMEALVQPPFRILFVIADAEAVKLPKSTQLVQEIVSATRDTAVDMSKAGGARANSEFRWTAHLDEFEHLMPAPQVASWARQDRRYSLRYVLYTQSLTGVEARLGEKATKSLRSAADVVALASKLGMDQGLHEFAASLLGRQMQASVSVSRSG